MHPGIGSLLGSLQSTVAVPTDVYKSELLLKCDRGGKQKMTSVRKPPDGENAIYPGSEAIRDESVRTSLAASTPLAQTRGQPAEGVNALLQGIPRSG